MPSLVAVACFLPCRAKVLSAPPRCRVRVGKHLSDVFPIRNVLKQGDALAQLLFACALEYVIRRVPVNQYGVKLSGTQQLLVNISDVNIWGGSVHTKKKNTELC